MQYLSRQPAPPLDAAIVALWYFRRSAGEMHLERVLPHGGPQIIVNLAEDETRTYEAGQVVRTAGSTVSGVATRALVIDTAEQTHVAGVLMRFGGTLPLFRMSTMEMVNQDVPLEVLWGRGRVQQMREQMLEAEAGEQVLDVLEAAMRQCWMERELHAVTRLGLGMIARSAGLARMADIAREMGVSQRWLIEKFKQDVGVAPKQLCRLLRFERAVEALHAGGERWVDVAVESGFYDQAHFNHEFREFAGITPGEYRAGRTEFANHVKILQAGGATDLRG
jgi:AraC-like DNA-binding protein